MGKVKIVIASVLKPLKDPRHYERFALSLAKANKYEINIIAIGEKKTKAVDNVFFHPMDKYPKTFGNRLLLQLKIFKNIWHLKADLLIICSIELLPYAVLIRLLHRTKIIYDIQENYRLNLKYLKEYSWVTRYLMRPVVVFIEFMSPLFINHFFLAEKCYATQLQFIKNRYTILENKTASINPLKPNKLPPKDGVIRLLFSGTISHYSGIHRVLNFIRELERKKVDFHLTIIGQVHDQKIMQILKHVEQKNITFNISDLPIDHQMIIDEIQQADLGLITYQPNAVNAHKVPTKLYEYTTFHLPYLVQEGTEWLKLGSRLGGAIPVDFEDSNIESILKKLPEALKSFVTKNTKKANWLTEEDLFFKSIDSLLK